MYLIVSLFIIMTDFLSDLNEAQKKAVEATDGAVLVIAGAGSGKTRVLTYRIAYLLSKGIDPFSILALTFTNKAASEMKERIASLVGRPKAKSLWMGTFHSVFAKILRFESERTGFPSNFTIYDTEDSKRLLKNIIKEQNFDEKEYKPAVVVNRISNAKNNLISVEEYNNDFEIQTYDSQCKRPHIGLIYKLYQQRLKKASAMDFDDLLFNTNVLLRDHPEALYKYQNKFKYILVDEYQDTNFAQYLIVKKLSANNENICVVGDDAQSIYAFRGANIQNIINFKKDYKDFSLFKLEQNYRSTKNIVDAANSVIENNKEQIKKAVWTNNEEGERIHLFNAANENEEAAVIGAKIFELMKKENFTPDNIAVLYRTNYQSRTLEESLRKLSIPYKVFGGVSFYQRKEVKDLLAYFRLIVNHYDEQAFVRIINFPARGIGDTTLNKILVAANENNVPVWDVAENPANYKVSIGSNIQNKISEFVFMIKSLKTQINKQNAYEIGKLTVNNSGIIKHYKDQETPESEMRLENIDELLNALKEFAENPDDVEGENSLKTIELFLEEAALMTDMDMEENKQNADNKSYVSLMTMHSAKGLEFPVVFLAGLEENLFPSQMSLESSAELEEERRLFYVAITRGMKKVFMSFAETRYRFGELNFCEHSRFIDEIDQKHIDDMAGIFSTFNKKPANFESFAESRSNFVSVNSIKKKQDNNTGNNDDSEFGKLSPSSLKVDMTIQHQRFGIGTIQLLEGKGENAKAHVLFNNFGKKQLLLKYAKLKILS